MKKAIYNSSTGICRGIDRNGELVLGTRRGGSEYAIVKAVNIRGFIKPRETGEAGTQNDCHYLSKRGMCMAKGEDKKDFWGYCPFIRAE